jgi:hypothetical protein
MQYRNDPRTNIAGFYNCNSRTHTVAYDCVLGLYHHLRMVQDKRVYSHSLDDMQYNDISSIDMKMCESVTLMMISLPLYLDILFS